MEIFKPARPVRVTEDMFEQILSRIADGDLKTGDKLPSERELALRFEVSRSTVRESLRMLEHAGMVRIKYGSQGGVIVEKAGHSLLANAMKLVVRLTQTSLMDLLEARKFNECAAARLAAERSDEEHLTKMRQTLEETEEHVDDLKVLAKANEDFHIAIAEAAQNPILLVTMQSIKTLIARSVFDLVSTPKMGKYILRAHTEIYQAIAERNPDAAQSAMNRHLETIEGRARQYLQDSEGGVEGTFESFQASAPHSQK